MTNANEMIIKTLKENKGAYIDTHNGKETLEENSIGYVVLENGKRKEEFVCPIYRNTFCLNPLFLEDGVVKLDTMSVGGVLECYSSITGNKQDDERALKNRVESEIDKFNEIHKDGNKCFASLQKITSYELISK